MNTSYKLGEDDVWGRRYYFTYYSEFGDRRGASGLEVLVMALSFVVAVAANLGIAICVLRYREMRTPTNLCLVNLAAADLLFALGVPAVAYTRLTQSWRLGEAVCRMLPYSQFVCGFVLLWTLTLISMDRHRCLAVAPYRSALTTGRVLAASLITWIIAAAVFLPAVFWFKTREVSGYTICTLVFPRSDILNVSLCFTIPIIIVACLLPMALLVYHYQRIFQRIIDTRNRWAVPCVAQGLELDPSRRRDSELTVVGTLVPWAGRKLSSASMTGGAPVGRQTRAGSLSQHEELRLHKHLRVVRILLLNVAAVLVMWLPITLLMLLIYLDGRRPTEDTNFFLRSHHFVWALIVAQFNTVVNPLLYGVFSENFRACIVKLWRRRHELGPQPGAQSGNNGGVGGGGAGGTTTSGERSGCNPFAASSPRPKSLKGFQDRLGPRANVPRCSIASIVEMPGSEKL